MHLVNVSAAEAEAALNELRLHVDPIVEIGTPLLVQPDTDPDAGACVQVLTSRGGWWVMPRGVVRVLRLPDDRSEITTFRDGVERFRTIRP